MKKRVTILLILFVGITTISLSHSGRTDSSGGHYNRSTGEYHYHHGYSAHQHPNGVCPYETSVVLNSSEETYNISNDDESSQINGLNKKIEELQSQITSKQNSIEKLNNELDEKKSEIKSLNNDISNLWIVFIFVFLLGIYISYNIGANKK